MIDLFLMYAIHSKQAHIAQGFCRGNVVAIYSHET